MKAKSFTKKNDGKKIRVCKKSTARIAVGEIEKNTDTFILTYGQFSLIDALACVLEQTGAAHVIISTWTAAHAHLDRSAALMEQSEILSFRMIVDRSFKSRQPKYYERMLELFGVDSIRQISTHAKFITVRNAKFDIVIRTSMNLNENPRLENLEISENKDFADFFEQITNSIFLEVKPGEQKTDQPKLSGVTEREQFQLCQAEWINPSNLNEPRCTHEVNN